VSPLAGLKLRYVIGKNSDDGADGVITEVGYDAPARPIGVGIKYCNLFDEKKSGRFGPYMRDTDTSAQYHEGHIDPKGPGFRANLVEQFARAKAQGFEYVELDNPDAYSVSDVLGAIELAATYGLKVIAKNPRSMDEDATPIIAHPNVYGIIVEKGAGTARQMHELRTRALKPDLPVWFVSFGSGRSWALSIAREIAA